MPPPDPAGPGEQGRDQQSVHDEAEQEEEQVEDLSSDGPTNNCRLRRRLETRRASSTTRLGRNHRTLSEEWLEPRDRDRVLCVGSVNHPVWAVIQGREGRTSSVTAYEHVLCLPECRRQMHGSRGRR